MTQSDENLRALAADYYISPEVFADEREKLFFLCWQNACHISELAEPGDYVATSI